MTPRVSIGLPVYNGRQFLPETLDSLLGQTYSDFELVISDNHSSDGTAELCQAYAARDSRIRYYSAPKNLGAAWNYNRVFHLSRGAYFKWAASDDLCAASFLERCVETLDPNPAAVCCYSKTRIIDADSKVIKDYDNLADMSDTCPRQRMLSLMASLRECNAVFGLMRSHMLRRTSLIGDYIGSDVFLLAELSLRGQLVELPDFLFYRRVHVAASSHDKSRRKQLQFFNPARVTHVVLPDCRRHYQNIRAVMRAPVAIADKSFLLAQLLKLSFHCRLGYLRELWQAARMTLGA
jgi:glycosyltransferase involved in cell wall biosynthesis